MVDRTSTLRFVAKDAASGPISGIDRQLKALGLSAGSSGRAMSGMGTLVGGSAAGFLGAGIAVGAFTGFLAESVKAAIADEESIKKLGAALKANVPAFDGNTDAIERSILSSQRLGFSDEDLRASLSRLVVATRDVGTAQQIQATAMDLARFKGIDLATATDALIRIEGGQFRALQALGIELAANATQTQALAAVQAVAAGQAEAAAGTTAGAMRQATLAIDELQEKIGKALLPALGGLARALSNDVIPAMVRFVEASGREIQAVQDFVGNLRNAVLDLASVSRATADAASESTALAQEQRNLARTAATMAKTISTAAVEVNDLGLTSDATAYYLNQMNEAQRAASASANASLSPYTNEAIRLYGVANAATIAAAALDAVNRTFRVSTAPRTNVRLPGTADADRRNAFDSGGDQAALDQAAGAFNRQAARDAEAAAARLAAAHKGVGSAARDAAKSIGSAFNNASAVASRYFDSVHNANVKAIKAAHARATAEIAAERRSVDARLTERKRLNAEPVTAAEKALADTQRGQTERNLGESLASAQQGTFNAETGGFDVDQRAVRDAQEALAAFHAQADIDRLRAVQATADAEAELDAVNANKALDKRQATADRTEILATAAEEKRFKLEAAAYAKRETELEKHLVKVHATHTRVLAEINAMYDDFGIASKGKSGGGSAVTVNVIGVTDPAAVTALVMQELKREQLRQGMTFA